MTLLFENWYNVLAVSVASGGGATIITVFILRWIREKRMDDAKVRQMEVQTDSLAMSEIKHVIEMYKHEIERKERMLDEMEEELNQIRRLCDQQKFLLDTEREKGKEMAIELEQVRIKLKRYEDNRRIP